MPVTIGALDEVRSEVDALSWLLDYRDEIRSDLSVFHRVDDMDSMPAHRFWSFATRLPFYDGAVRAMIRADAAGQPAAAPVATPEPELEVWQMAPKPPPGAEVIAPGGAAAMLASYGSAHVSHGRAPLA